MNSAATREAGFRADINAMRALAVLAVVAFHFGVPGAHAGYLGVDVFFVISGYLIGGQIASRIAHGTFSLAGFFAGRIRRIVPALVVLCTVVLAWGWFFQLGPDYKALAWSARSSLLFVSNGLFAKQLGYFDLSAAYKPLLHTWSLSIEGQFYLLLPLVALALARVAAPVRALATGLVIVLSFAAALHQDRDPTGQVFFSFTARAWEFLVGCAAAWWPPLPLRRWPMTARRLLAGVACGALADACFLLPRDVVWPGPWTLVPVSLSAFVMVLGEGVSFGRLTHDAALQQVGNISYSMYLWHWPIIVAARLMANQNAFDLPTLLGLFALTCSCAWLSWRFVEQPWRRSGSGSPRRAIGGYAIAAILFLTFSLAMVKTDGLPSRLPGYAQGANLASIRNQKLPECRSLPGAAAAADPSACDIGNVRAKPPTFAIWGDSHALMYLDALRASHPGATGWLFHHAGCEPALPGRTGRPPCDRHNDEVRKLLQATPSLTTVVIAMRQNAAARSGHAWEQARALLAAGYRVVFLGPLPEAHGPVAQEWGMRQLIQREPIPDVTIARDRETGTESYDVRWRRWKNGAALEAHSRLVALDLGEVFCDAAKCWLVRGGAGLFRDTDHLTSAGAALVMPHLLGALGISGSP